MAQADLLVKLVKSASSGDQPAIRKVAEALIEEEKRKGHRILADRLAHSLAPDQANSRRDMMRLRRNGGGGRHEQFCHEIIPERELKSLVLPEPAREQIRELVEEHHRAELLHAYNLPARNRVLLAGPPGNGKTTLAEALAHELMYPLIVVRYETLVGSYLGETAGRLKYLMDYVKTQRCVLFFDEFETLGKERGDTHETGEIKRVVSSLLLQIDSLPDYVVVVAASNHPELLDRAVWRRFQLRLELPAPTPEQLAWHIRLIGKRCKTQFGYEPDELAKRLQGANYAEAEEFCLGVVRRAVLDRQTDNAKDITKKILGQWCHRLSVPANASNGASAKR